MRAAVLVPAPGFHESWDWAFDVEARALRQAGFDVEARPWNDVGDLSQFDLVTPLVAWGYHLDHPRWETLLDRLEKEAVPTLNPVGLLRWNSDKHYLSDLADAGVATIPTMFVENLEEEVLAGARQSFGAELVIKPLVSASADGTYRLGPGDPIPEDARTKMMMVQPFLASIAEEGEYSIMMFGGEYSHAIVKRPKPGDFRVQPHLGGSELACAPPRGAVELAQAALAAAPTEAIYARVDMVRDSGGQLVDIELELIEPALWLQHSPDQGANFGAAFRSALASRE